MIGPHIFLLAGEPSGDLLGARLMQALKKKLSNAAEQTLEVGEEEEAFLQFTGVGGMAMAEEGLNSLFPMSELSVMGFTEIFPRLPNIMKRLKQTTQAVLSQKPDVVVTIDSPEFSFRLARRLHGRGIPVVHYAAPSVWAWRPGRARKIAKILDHLMTLLPFEPPYFTAENLPSTFVGHPVLEAGIEEADTLAFQEKYGIGADCLCVLPGSRRSEVAGLLPIFQQTVEILRKQNPNLQVILPTVPAVEDLVRAHVKGWPVRTLLLEEESEKFAAMCLSRAAIAASGTVALELAAAGTPMVVAYKMHTLTGWLARRLIKIPHVCLVNIMAGRSAVPECLQNACTPENIAGHLEALMTQPKAAAAQKAVFEHVLHHLSPPDCTPSEKAAEVVLDVIMMAQPRAAAA